MFAFFTIERLESFLEYVILNLSGGEEKMKEIETKKAIETIEKEIEAMFLYDSILIQLQDYTKRTSEWETFETGEQQQIVGYSLGVLLTPTIQSLADLCAQGVISIEQPPTIEYWNHVRQDYSKELSEKALSQLSMIRRTFEPALDKQNFGFLKNLLQYSQVQKNYYKVDIVGPLLPYVDFSSDMATNMIGSYIYNKTFEQAFIIFEKILRKYGKENLTKAKEKLEQAFQCLTEEEKESYQTLVRNVLFQDQQHERNLYLKNKQEQQQIGIIPMEQYPNTEMNELLKETVQQKKEYKQFVLRFLSQITKYGLYYWDNILPFLSFILDRKQFHIDYDILEAYYITAITNNEVRSYSLNYEQDNKKNLFDLSQLFTYDPEKGTCSDLLETTIQQGKDIDLILKLFQIVPEFQKRQKLVLQYLLEQRSYQQLSTLVEEGNIKLNLSMLQTIKDHFLPRITCYSQENEALKHYYLVLLDYLDQSLPDGQQEREREKVMQIIDVLLENERDLTFEENAIFNSYCKRPDSTFWSLFQQELAKDVKEKVKSYK